ncbi:hypothetical protein BHM03_00018064 [Ensete ventricosum]|nr:hypothetical protein BHM03_00018064 [Ensete ventricosum]
MSVAELKERHVAATATVTSLRERLKQRRQLLVDTDGGVTLFLGVSNYLNLVRLSPFLTLQGHTGKVVLNLGELQNSHEGRISCLGLSSDGSALCTGSWDKNLKVHFPCSAL